MKITFLIFFFVQILFAYSHVLKTGQTMVYKKGDDGTYQAGSMRSYTRSATGIVTDNITSLEWQDNVISSTMNWDAAKDYCNNFTLSGDGWRLPNIKELISLIDRSRLSSTIDSIFQNTSSSPYWSSTPDINPEYGNVWGVDFRDGNSFETNKAIPFHVRCVRGTNTSLASFIRDSTFETVFDNRTGLTWQDNDIVLSQTFDWNASIDYCENLDFAEKQDWRLPNINELFSIIDFSRNPAIDSSFLNISTSNFWSSTSFDTLKAWNIYFYIGLDGQFDKTNTFKVRCVRGEMVKSSQKTISPLLLYILE